MVTIPLDVFDVLKGASSAVITPLGGAAVTSIVQWEQQEAAPAEQGMAAGTVSAANRRQVAYVRRDEVPTLPDGSTIVGGPAHNPKTWRVISVDRADEDYHVATLV